jgi:hypothetical protein
MNIARMRFGARVKFPGELCFPPNPRVDFAEIEPAEIATASHLATGFNGEEAGLWIKR